MKNKSINRALSLMLNRFISKLGIISCFCAFSLNACMMGPDFKTPAAPNVKPLKVADSTQHFTLNQTIPADWWTLYHSPALNELITTGLTNSPTIDAATATLRQAKEQLNAQTGNLLLPAVTLDANGQRQRTGIASGEPAGVFNLYNASVSVAYTLDVWGASRRQIEGARAAVENQQHELRAAQLMLTGNIATSAIMLASFNAQKTATEALIKAQSDQLDLMQKQLSLGGVSQQDILAQQTQLEQTRALLPPIKKSLFQTQNALAVLVGRFPDEKALPFIQLDTLSLPASLPISIPSDIVKQRPDIQASLALLHQASAAVGVATANMFPQMTLNGSYGGSSTILNTLFNASTRTWSFGPQLAAPLFNGGALSAQKRAAIAAFDAANAQYHQTVLSAFQNVADSLRAVETDARLEITEKKAESTAHAALELTRQQFTLGGVSFLAVLNAESQYNQAIVQRILATAARLTDTVALFQSLGGGWWNQKGVAVS